MAARSTSATRRRSSTTPARTRSAPPASWRSRRSWRAATGSGWSGCEAPRAPAETLTAVHPPRYVRGIEELCAARRRRDRRRHARRRGLLRGGAARGRRRLRARRPAAAAARRRPGFCALRPPGHHAEPRARDGLLPVRQRRGRGAARARRARARARAGARLGRPPRQRHERDLPRLADGAVRLASTSGRSIPAPGRRATSGSGAGAGYTINLPVPAGAGDAALRLAARARRRAARARATRPSSILISAGFDAHRDDPLAGCRADRGRLRGARRARVRAPRRRAGGAGRRGARGRLRPARARRLDGGDAAGADGAGSAGARSDVPLVPEARAAAARLAEHWPALAASEQALSRAFAGRRIRCPGS